KSENTPYKRGRELFQLAKDVMDGKKSENTPYKRGQKDVNIKVFKKLDNNQSANSAFESAQFVLLFKKFK
ncbi:hypothetical protein, partial [Staphylococcus lugdunensis]|uniref:hypothetical protein n=2 Tax=Staphylococcus lugdunensis TaxID=28035 RepID=UPI001F58E892